jgi:hypothetical protein
MAELEYPLDWPAGWPRTPDDQRRDSRYRFKRASGLWTYREAAFACDDEVRLMGGKRVVITSDAKVGPRGGLSEEPADPGVAVYFQLDGGSKVIAVDMHTRPAENLRAISLALDAMRALERHGGGILLDRAFAGFAALPPPGDWRSILGLTAERPTEAMLDAAYRIKAREAHPDRGGSDAAMAEVNKARADARVALGFD